MISVQVSDLNAFSVNCTSELLKTREAMDVTMPMLAIIIAHTERQVTVAVRAQLSDASSRGNNLAFGINPVTLVECQLLGFFSHSSHLRSFPR